MEENVGSRTLGPGNGRLHGRRRGRSRQIPAGQSRTPARTAPPRQRPAGHAHRPRRAGNGGADRSLDLRPRTPHFLPRVQADAGLRTAHADLFPRRRLGLGERGHARPNDPRIRRLWPRQRCQRGLCFVARGQIPPGAGGMRRRRPLDRRKRRPMGPRRFPPSARRRLGRRQSGTGDRPAAARHRRAGAAGDFGELSGVRQPFRYGQLQGVRGRRLRAEHATDVVLLGCLRRA